MWWKREQKTEFLPWYRVPGFKGKVSGWRRLYRVWDAVVSST